MLIGELNRPIDAVRFHYLKTPSVIQYPCCGTVIVLTFTHSIYACINISESLKQQTWFDNATDMANTCCLCVKQREPCCVQNIEIELSELTFFGEYPIRTDMVLKMFKTSARIIGNDWLISVSKSGGDSDFECIDAYCIYEYKTPVCIRYY